MVTQFLTKIFGSRNDRILKGYQRKVDQVNLLEETFKNLSDEALKNKTTEFKTRLNKGESLDTLIPESFAVVREASLRTLKQRHYDVQLMGAMALHEGNVIESLTGEGKTLIATAAAYLNALKGQGVHIITVNDYLAQRDTEWMGKIYKFLGLSVGCIVSNLDNAQRKEAYNADITYGTNNEFGFDYLRDNMTFSSEERVQRDLHFAILDEADSILIDEARTPLIISGPVEDSSELYQRINELITQLKPSSGEKSNDGDFWINEKDKQIVITDQGHSNLEVILDKESLIEEGTSLYDPKNVRLLHYINACLRAHNLFNKNIEYVVKDDKIIIIDEHTGRSMPGRRWSDGLHQAIEAKENVSIQAESQTLASITFQNYFRLYTKLSGMTGTADTEAPELNEIYNLEVVIIPTHRPMVRMDNQDIFYMNMEEKYEAILKSITEIHKKGQPILVGTTSIETSELISSMLKKANLPHNILNAKHHAKEAVIIEQAGCKGAITIATNMAGRGTDIRLGGNLEQIIHQLKNPSSAEIKKAEELWQQEHELVKKLGGLHVLGTERNESRRVDNQLRGRSGRQGDPGSSQFYLSIEDNLMRIFASERIQMIMQKIGVKKGEVLQAPMLNRAIESAQKKVEAYHFDIRKQLLRFDNVANEQRRIIYSQRKELQETDTVSDIIQDQIASISHDMAHKHTPDNILHEMWDIDGLQSKLQHEFLISLDLKKQLDECKEPSSQWMKDLLTTSIKERYQQQIDNHDPKEFSTVEKMILTQTLDHQWKDHLATMDHLRQSIHLRGYAQKNPQNEYKNEAYTLFQFMLNEIKYQTVSQMLRIKIKTKEPEPHITQPYSMHFNLKNKNPKPTAKKTKPSEKPTKID
ncbi:MAG TPA: preprotein translocase subunit SecA [Gammaproteobacteria bacterium]|nr:preprotein translocase subunit SecA [Gammaproteobacteria bacterium]